MQRNMDLVREILLQAEAAEDGKIALNGLPAEYGEADVGRPVELTIEPGLLRGAVVPGGGGPEPRVLAFDIRQMTWEGRDVLDAARSETTWIKARRLCRENTGGPAFDLLKMCLLKTAGGAIAA